MSARAIRWHRVVPSRGVDRDWDSVVARAADGNVFQSSAWAEYKRRAGWSPERWTAVDGAGQTMMAVQLLTRSLPGGSKLGWVPGGPVFRFSPDAEERASVALLNLIDVAASSRFAYVRFGSLAPREPRFAYGFRRVLNPCASLLGSGYSVTHDLTQPAYQLDRGLSEHNRHYLERARRAGVRVEHRTDDEGVVALARLYGEMRHLKGLRLRPYDADELRELRRLLGDDAVVLAASVSSEVVGATLASTFARRAQALVAATGPRGRQVGAGYVLTYELLRHLRERGVTEIDLGAVDPRDVSSGVNFYKLGFGGRLLEYLGEWEWARFPWIGWAANILIARRAGLA